MEALIEVAEAVRPLIGLVLVISGLVVQAKNDGKDPYNYAYGLYLTIIGFMIVFGRFYHD